MNKAAAPNPKAMAAITVPMTRTVCLCLALDVAPTVFWSMEIPKRNDNRVIVGDPFARRKDYASTAYCPALPGLRPGAAGSLPPPEPVAPPLPLLPIGPFGATTGPLMSLPPMLVPVQLQPAMHSAIAPANSARLAR
jgi:hypothetical protein